MCKYKRQNICIVYRDRYKVPRGAMIVKLGSCTWNTFGVRHDPADTGMIHGMMLCGGIKLVWTICTDSTELLLFHTQCTPQKAFCNQDPFPFQNLRWLRCQVYIGLCPVSFFSAPRCVGTEPGRSTMSFRSTLQPEDSADSDLSYRCINHKYLSDNPDKMQHSGSRHKHHQTLNTHHQQIPAKLTITWPTHTSATYITHNSHSTHTSHITPKNSRHLSFFLAHKVGSVWCPLSFGWSAFVTRPSSVKIWRLGKLPDFGEGECDNFPSNTGQCELREHNPKKGKKEVYTVSNRVFFLIFSFGYSISILSYMSVTMLHG